MFIITAPGKDLDDPNLKFGNQNQNMNNLFKLGKKDKKNIFS